MNMKKFVAICLVIVCALVAMIVMKEEKEAATVNADATVENATRVEGLIVGSGDNYFIMQDKDLGELQVNLSGATVLEGVSAAELSFGQYVFVDFDGKMTRSLPPQISAMKVAMYGVSGTVVEVGETSITIEQENDAGQAIIHLIDSAMAPALGDVIVAYTNGAMTMSLPPQTTALAIDVMTPAN